MLLALAALVPAILVHEIVPGIVSFTLALFFLDTAITPMWVAATDIAPEYAGSSSALMNAAGAVAGILSPVVFGFILDRTGSWTMPFAVSLALLLLGAVTALWTRPDLRLRDMPQRARLAVAN
jgi:predicted MFS family arabinose efflux permease